MVEVKAASYLHLGRGYVRGYVKLCGCYRSEIQFNVYRLTNYTAGAAKIKDKCSHHGSSVRNFVLRNFKKVAGMGRYLFQSLFFLNKVTDLSQAGLQLYEKETLAQVFSSQFCKISKNICFTEHLWTNASERIRIHLPTT